MRRHLREVALPARAPVPGADLQVARRRADLQRHDLAPPPGLGQGVAADVRQMLAEQQLQPGDNRLRALPRRRPPRGVLDRAVDLGGVVHRHRAQEAHAAGHRAPGHEEVPVVVRVDVAHVPEERIQPVGQRGEVQRAARAAHELGDDVGEHLRRQALLAGRVGGEVAVAVRVQAEERVRGERRLHDVGLVVRRAVHEAHRQAAPPPGVQLDARCVAAREAERLRPARVQVADLLRAEVGEEDRPGEVADVPEVLADEPVEVPADEVRPALAHALARGKPLEVRDDGRHRERGRRAVTGDVAEDEHARLVRQLLPVAEVAGHDVVRTRKRAVEELRPQRHGRRQECVLHVRGDLEVGAERGLQLRRLPLGAVAAHGLADAREQHVAPRVLRHVGRMGVGGDALLQLVRRRVDERREEDDRDARVEATHRLAEREAVHRAHHHVGEDEVVGTRLEFGDALLGRLDRRHLEARRLQQRRDREAGKPLVVHQQDAPFSPLAHARPPACLRKCPRRRPAPAGASRASGGRS